MMEMDCVLRKFVSSSPSHPVPHALLPTPSPTLPLPSSPSCPPSYCVPSYCLSHPLHPILATPTLLFQSLLAFHHLCSFPPPCPLHHPLIPCFHPLLFILIAMSSPLLLLSHLYPRLSSIQAPKEPFKMGASLCYSTS